MSAAIIGVIGWVMAVTNERFLSFSFITVFILLIMINLLIWGRYSDDEMFHNYFATYRAAWSRDFDVCDPNFKDFNLIILKWWPVLSRCREIPLDKYELCATIFEYNWNICSHNLSSMIGVTTQIRKSIRRDILFLKDWDFNEH